MNESPEPESSPTDDEVAPVKQTWPLPVSVAELADLAIRCATLKGGSSPNLFEALMLVHECERISKSPNYFSEVIEYAETVEETDRVKEIVLSADSGSRRVEAPEDDATYILEFKLGEGCATLPGAGIKEPDSFPISRIEAIGEISGEPNIPRRKKFYAKYLEAGHPNVEDAIPDRASYWEFAATFHAFCPRHKDWNEQRSSRDLKGISSDQTKPAAKTKQVKGKKGRENR